MLTNIQSLVVWSQLVKGLSSNIKDIFPEQPKAYSPKRQMFTDRDGEEKKK